MTAAMILAAGRGERLRPLTDAQPKALLEIAGEPLIGHTLRALAAIGADPIVVNLSYRGAQIQEALGDGQRYGVRVLYSQEPDVPLDTGGGILHALPMLGEDPFWVANADVYTDYAYPPRSLADDDLAHLVLVDNPDHHPQGDFHFADDRVCQDTGQRLTFAGIGLYRPQLFSECQPGRFSLVPLLREAIENQQVSAEHYRGDWMDVGTPERLDEALAHAHDKR